MALRSREFGEELSAIVGWWLKHALDGATGGVHGEISDDNEVRAGADRGVVLQTRTLWFLSEFYLIEPDEKIRSAARNLYSYIVARCIDQEHGGVVWRLAGDGAWADARKQVYAQAFAIYAFSAYADAFGDEDARWRAIGLAGLLEDRARDRDTGGYVEAFARDWAPISDWRLSDRDLNAPKTMNTHLHILEAYTALYQETGDTFAERILREVLELFIERFIRPSGDHLTLFYSLDWENQSTDESYGHDIEASWLICEAAEALGDDALKEVAKRQAVALANAALSAVSPGGGLLYERTAEHGVVADHCWWPQAEALIGFYNAYQLTGDLRFEEAAEGVWRFIKETMVDRVHGEWSWQSAADAPRRGPYKVGFWKGPYHNGRAMMQMVRRLESAA